MMGRWIRGTARAISAQARAFLRNPSDYLKHFQGRGGLNMDIGNRFPLSKLTKDKRALELDGSRHTVVYFYPKDDTPGCTIEAQEFEKLKGAFAEAGIRILGVSVDESDSHQEFCDKFGLTFELATDPEGRLGNELGIMKGALHQRVTYVLDSDGHVILSYPQVSPAGHAQQILDDLAKHPTASHPVAEQSP